MKQYAWKDAKQAVEVGGNLTVAFGFGAVVVLIVGTWMAGAFGDALDSLFVPGYVKAAPFGNLLAFGTFFGLLFAIFWLGQQWLVFCGVLVEKPVAADHAQLAEEIHAERIDAANTALDLAIATIEAYQREKRVNINGLTPDELVRVITQDLAIKIAALRSVKL